MAALERFKVPFELFFHNLTHCHLCNAPGAAKLPEKVKPNICERMSLVRAPTGFYMALKQAALEDFAGFKQTFCFSQGELDEASASTCCFNDEFNSLFEKFLSRRDATVGLLMSRLLTWNQAKDLPQRFNLIDAQGNIACSTQLARTFLY